MRIQVTLTADDVKKAIDMWLRTERGMRAVGPLHVEHSPGDRPWESGTTTFEVDAESIGENQRGCT